MKNIICPMALHTPQRLVGVAIALLMSLQSCSQTEYGLNMKQEGGGPGQTAPMDSEVKGAGSQPQDAGVSSRDLKNMLAAIKKCQKDFAEAVSPRATVQFRLLVCSMQSENDQSIFGNEEEKSVALGLENSLKEVLESTIPKIETNPALAPQLCAMITEENRLPFYVIERILNKCRWSEEESEKNKRLPFLRAISSQTITEKINASSDSSFKGELEKFLSNLSKALKNENKQQK